MDDQQFLFSRSTLAHACVFTAYFAASWLVWRQVDASLWRAVYILLLFALLALDIRRCGLAGAERPAGLKLYRKRWQLLVRGQWIVADCAVYYRCWLFVMLSWQREAGQRSRYVVIWRDTLAPAQWRLLRAYTYLMPATRVHD